VHGLLLVNGECTDQGGKPSRFLLGMLSIMRAVVPVRVASPGVVYHHGVGALLLWIAARPLPGDSLGTASAPKVGPRRRWFLGQLVGLGGKCGGFGTGH
jgi:hypothetical protein